MLAEDLHYDLSINSPDATPLDHATTVRLYCNWHKSGWGGLQLSQAVSLHCMWCARATNLIGPCSP